MAFTGDLIEAPGKVRSIAEMQHHYGGNEGADFTIYSLSKLRDEAPAVLLPVAWGADGGGARRAR